MKRPRYLLLIAGFLSATPAMPSLAQESQADADLAMQAKAEPYIAFADQIVAALATGQGGAFRASLSPTMLKATPSEEIDAFVDRQAIPFFADYARPGAEQWIAPTSHPAGMTGFAFYRSFITTGGAEKPFALYILGEDGRLVVGNLVVGRRFQDVHPHQ